METIYNKSKMIAMKFYFLFEMKISISVSGKSDEEIGSLGNENPENYT